MNKTYHKLAYMKTTPDKDDIFNVLKDTSLQEFGKPVENHLAVNELDDYIEQETQSHAKPPLKTVLNKFKQVPYGFVDLDIEWLVAALFAQKRIYLEKTSQFLSLKKEGAREISNLLTDRREHAKILIDRKELTDPKMIKNVKEVLKDLFGMVNSPNDDDSLMNIFQKESQEKVREIDLLLKEYDVESRYPGKNTLMGSRELLQDVNNINSLREFFKFVSDHKNEFLDNAEDLEPVIHFFNGSQKGIFKNACDLVDLFDKDKNFIEDSKLTAKAKEIKNITEMSSPYSQIQKLPVISDEFKTSHNDILIKKSNPIIKEISTSLTEILGLLNSPELKAEFEVEFTENFTELEEKLKKTQEISAIPGIQTESEILKDKCIDEVEAYQRTIPVPPDDETPKIDIKTIKLKKISSETMITIKDEKDIDEFFESLKTKLKDELGENTIITLRI
ncbi:hypothetical protein [Methanobacterium ferruginis]|uniref:hypothetical protein n=1 Tax=Methanobacterium ferruginis TaxID=710191 RepID=UPI002573BB41|nr:hypothetical protein [Methanobacterium ferruginis]